MKLLICFIAIGCMLQNIAAQDYAGQWEGELTPPGGGKRRMKVRLELLQQGADVMGIVYTRGFEKGITFGCDLFVTGKVFENSLSLRNNSVLRDFNTGNACSLFREILLEETSNSDAKLQGRWLMLNGSAFLRLQRTDSVISPLASDEVQQYFRASLKT